MPDTLAYRWFGARIIGAIAAAVFVLVWPTRACADAALPMIVVTLPAMAVAFIPIVIFEAWIFARDLSVGARSALVFSAVANATSTFIGMPLTWVALAALQILTERVFGYGLGGGWRKVLALTLQAPLVVPYDNAPAWLVPAATLFLLLPFFFVSCWSESLVVFRLSRTTPRDIIRRAVRRANLASYAALMILTLAWLWVSIRAPQRRQGAAPSITRSSSDGPSS